jgi:hypothetical protein
MGAGEIDVLLEKMKANPFVLLQEQYSSYYKINKQTENSANYIAPREMKLPPNARGKVCTFQYVPITETVASIVGDPEFQNLTQATTTDGVLYDIKDGSAWRNNKYFQDNPEALTGQLYSDAIELENPLGAAKGVNKALNVYFSLVDIPKVLRSKIENIFLVLTIKEKELKENKENYVHFFKPLVDDLKKLEAGIQVGGRTIKMGLICYSADNLEASSVGGFSQCFSSVDVCRICHQQYRELPEITGIPKKEPWTREEYDAAVDSIQPGVRGEFGINSTCLFNELASFHCVGQMPLDIMHDFMEKVAACDAMSIIKSFVSSGIFTLEEYNSVLRDVKLGDYEAADRPMIVNAKSAKLPGKALAVSQHLRLLPFFVWRTLDGNVGDSDIVDLMVILARIQEYLMADRLSIADIDNFEDLVVEYFSKRKICEEQFETFTHLTPKYHYLGTVAFKVAYSKRVI